MKIDTIFKGNLITQNCVDKFYFFSVLGHYSSVQFWNKPNFIKKSLSIF